MVALLAAVRNASDTALSYTVSMNLEHCILEDIQQGAESRERLQLAVQLLIKTR